MWEAHRTDLVLLSVEKYFSNELLTIFQSITMLLISLTLKIFTVNYRLKEYEIMFKLIG